MGSTNKNNSRLYDVLAATPFGEKGQKAMGRLNTYVKPDEFLTKVYVEPFAALKVPMPEEDKTYDKDDYQSETAFDELLKIGFDQIKLNRLREEKRRFEDDIKALSQSLYIISGSAGSGKTTYFHKLQHDVMKQWGVYYCDIALSRDSYKFLGDNRDIQENNNVWKFIGYILNNVLDPILKTDKFDDAYKSRIKSIAEIYDQYINTQGDNKGQYDFFSLLRSYGNGNYKDIDGVFVHHLRQHIFKKIDTLKDKIKETEDQEKKQIHLQEAVSFVIGIIIRMFFCLSKMDSKNKKYICVIDSIEHYIYHKRKFIQNTEIMAVTKGIIDAVRDIRPVITPMRLEQGEEYKTFYGIMLIMRDTSETITECKEYYSAHNLEYGDSDLIDIDISEWFDANSIAKNKEEIFGVYLDAEDKDVKIAYDNVVGDISPYRWAIHGLVNRMYNHNQRGIADCLVNALIYNKEKLAFFNAKWDQAKNEKEVTKKNVLKYMCRQYIFRLLLDYIQQTGYFTKLMARTNDIDITSEKTSYARKISTTLLNHDLQLKLNRNNRSNGFISFSALIKSVFVPKYLADGHPTDDEIQKLGDILYLMNEPDESQTHWSALVEIKYDANEEYTPNNLIKFLKQEWKTDNNSIDTSKFGVKIRPAGRFFADIVPEFEYFSCRANKIKKDQYPYPPLFEKSNLDKINGEYLCIKIIQKIREQAVACATAVVYREQRYFKHLGIGSEYSYSYNLQELPWLYKSNIDSTPELHPIRIFQKHIGYLENYQHYIDFFGECSEQDKQAIIKCINSEINKYNKAKMDLEFMNKRYFNWTIKNKSV